MPSSVLRRARLRVAAEDRGATAVEFALLFPLFLVICFGTITGGILFSDKLALTQGVREAARYGATLPYEPAERDLFLTQIRQSAQDADYGQLGEGQPAYCVAIRTKTGENWHLKPTASSAASGPCPGTSSLPATEHVLVTAEKPATLNMLLYSFDLTIGSTSVARHENNTT